VAAEADGTPFKSYKAEVRGGKLQRHPRISLDTQPRTAFISPRLGARASSRHATPRATPTGSRRTKEGSQSSIVNRLLLTRLAIYSSSHNQARPRFTIDD
jgi:hypothetical protein